MIGFMLILLNVFFSGGSAFEKDLSKYFETKFSEYESFDFEVMQMPANYLSISIDKERDLKVTKQFAYVPVKITDKKKNEISSFITCRVKLYKSVLKAVEKIAKDDELSAGSFVVEKCDVAGLRGTPVLDFSKLEGCRSKFYIYKDSFLVEESIEKIPDVMKGDKLVLHTGKNGVDVSMEVSARQEGYIGDIIRVNADGNKIYAGKIIDKYNLALTEQ